MTTYINILGAKYALITGVSYAYDHIHKRAETWDTQNLKTGVGASSPWVRIPPHPPFHFNIIEEFSESSDCSHCRPNFAHSLDLAEKERAW
jgi:hypothetical protein